MHNLQREFYGEYEHVLNRAMTKIMRFSVNITNQKNYIEHIRSRLKDPKSIEQKLANKGLEFTLDNAKNELHDLVGVRLICNFLSDIYIVADLLQQNYTVLAIKDYISQPKSNGYRSFHIIVSVPVEGQNIPVEIQIRTISQDSWASLEHKLKYKKNIKNEKLIRAELKRFADDMAGTDLCMQTIKEFIEDLD
ncbi:MAG: RelA/SpoT domain protein [Clostridia bacterium]